MTVDKDFTVQHKQPGLSMDAATPTINLRQFLSSYAFRVCVYGAVTLAVFSCANLGIEAYGAEFMGTENGPLELAQVVFAITGAVLLFCAAHWTPIGRGCLVVAAALVAYAAARESDLIFESLMFDDAYKWVVGMPLAALVAVAVVRDRERLMEESICLMRRPGATLFVVAGIYLCFVCQYLDRPEMWTGITKKVEAAHTKAMVEEYTELFAYLLLAYCGFEAAIVARQDRQAAANITHIDKQPNDEASYPRIAA